MRRSLLRRSGILAACLALVIPFAATSATADAAYHPAPEDYAPAIAADSLSDAQHDGVINLSDPDASTGSGWTRNANRLYTLQDGANVLITGASAGSANPVSRVQVLAGASATAILQDATIDMRGGTFVPIQINAGAHLDLFLEGANYLFGGGGSPGLQVTAGTSVRIDGTGSLVAQGNGAASGIGGRSGASNGAGRIEIVGGTVTALAGGNNAAGIGGGGNGHGGYIGISGGTVTATGGNGAAAIGGGATAGANVIITGGHVSTHTTQSTLPANATFIPQAIGAGAPSATVTPVANVLVALPSSDLDITWGAFQSGAPAPEAPGKVTLTSAAATASLNVAHGIPTFAPTVVTLATGQAHSFLLSGSSVAGTVSLDLATGWTSTPASLTPAFLAEGGTIEVAFDNQTPFYPEIDLSRTGPQQGEGWSYDPVARVFTIADGADVLVVGDNTEGEWILDQWDVPRLQYTGNRLVVEEDADVTITLRDAIFGNKRGNIHEHSVANPISLAAGASANLVVEGENTLVGQNGFAAIHVPVGTTLVVDGPGSLHAYGGVFAAGIGGNDHLIEPARSASVGTITINGATIVAGGGSDAAGIGSGRTSNLNPATGGTITINDGAVYARSGLGGGANSQGAGIGGGRESDAGTITITGGTVQAFGRPGIPGAAGGAGIGTGTTTTVGGLSGTVVITGGTITATGGQGSAAIGGGLGVQGVTVEIGGNAVVTATAVSAASLTFPATWFPGQASSRANPTQAQPIGSGAMNLAQILASADNWDEAAALVTPPADVLAVLPAGRLTASGNWAAFAPQVNTVAFDLPADTAVAVPAPFAGRSFVPAADMDVIVSGFAPEAVFDIYVPAGHQLTPDVVTAEHLRTADATVHLGPIPQVVLASVQVTGSAVIGETLTASATGLDPAGATVIFEWLHGTEGIGTGPEFALTDAALVGAEIVVRATASADRHLPVTVSSAPVTIVAAAFTSGSVTITGEAIVGETLTAHATFIPASGETTFQWFADGEPIVGATGPQLTLTAALAGAEITVSATGTAVGHAALTVTSVATAPVALPPAMCAYEGLEHLYADDPLCVSPGDDGRIFGADRLAVRRGNHFFKSFDLVGGIADVNFTFGRAGDEVFMGDWNGNGIDTPAVRRGNRFYLTNHQQGGWADTVFTFGRVGDEVFVGDWNASGVDSFAIRRGNQIFVSNSFVSGPADEVFTFGRAADELLPGNFDGEPGDTFAVRRGNEIFVSNTLRGGNADYSFTFGRATDDVFVGDWNGSGYDTWSLRRGNEFFKSYSRTGATIDHNFTFGRLGDDVFVGHWGTN